MPSNYILTIFSSFYFWVFFVHFLVNHFLSKKKKKCPQVSMLVSLEQMTGILTKTVFVSLSQKCWVKRVLLICAIFPTKTKLFFSKT